MKVVTSRPSIGSPIGDARPLPSLMASPYHRIQERPYAPNSSSDRRPARHHAQVQAPQKRTRSPAPRQAKGHSPPGPQNDSHDTLSEDASTQMTHFFEAPTLKCHTMTHFVRSPALKCLKMTRIFRPPCLKCLRMTRISTCPALKCLKMTHFPAFHVPQNTPSPCLSSRQRPRLLHKMTHLKATPTLPDTPSPSGRPQSLSIVASSCLRRHVIQSGAQNLTHIRETLHSAQGDNYEAPPGAPSQLRRSTCGDRLKPVPQHI